MLIIGGEIDRENDTKIARWIFRLRLTYIIKLIMKALKCFDEKDIDLKDIDLKNLKRKL